MIFSFGGINAFLGKEPGFGLTALLSIALSLLDKLGDEAPWSPARELAPSLGVVIERSEGARLCFVARNFNPWTKSEPFRVKLIVRFPAKRQVPVNQNSIRICAFRCRGNTATITEATKTKESLQQTKEVIAAANRYMVRSTVSRDSENIEELKTWSHYTLVYTNSFWHCWLDQPDSWCDKHEAKTAAQRAVQQQSWLRLKQLKTVSAHV